MSPRRELVLALVVAGCGSSEPQAPTTPTEDVAASCPSEAAPERCRDLAEAAAHAGHPELAWAYTVLECESPTGAQCVAMWQRHAKVAPTQTDALSVLHAACDHVPAACEALAAWHTERGHVLAAAAYHKRAGQPGQARAVSSLALANDLAAVMHVSGTTPRTDAIAQLVGHELRAPGAQLAAAKPKLQRKAWPMHAATQGTSTDACPATAMLDRHPTPVEQCVTEVRPFDVDQIALMNRCSQAVVVAYAGARADHSTYANQLRLDRYQARSIGISHRELGPLTYAVCADACRVTGSPDDVTASWTGNDARYYCARGGR